MKNSEVRQYSKKEHMRDDEGIDVLMMSKCLLTLSLICN